MEHEALLRRAEDLFARCDRAGLVTSTAFLTPAEQAALEQYFRYRAGCRMIFSGGNPACERRVAFFLPDWLEESAFESSEYIHALKITAYYGTPGHRDYLGALLALGVRREWVGDIWVHGQNAWVFCLPSVSGQLSGLEQAGRVHVKAEEALLSDIPDPEIRRKEVRFTVQSARLDAVLSDVFRISRSLAVKQIAAGLASVNHLPCLKADASIQAGDILSLKGYGKAEIREIGGASRKGRIFVVADIYL